jgi:type III restriction enzyme
LQTITFEIARLVVRKLTEGTGIGAAKLRLRSRHQLFPLIPIPNRYKPIGSTAEVDFKTTRPCYATIKSHINHVVLDTATWEQSAAFRLEQSGAVAFYARNDHLEFVIPCEYLGISHGYTPDYLVRLTNDVTLILEIKGYEDDQDRAKHQAGQRWKAAVNRWGQLGLWDFHLCRNPQMLGRELEWLCGGDTN